MYITFGNHMEPQKEIAKICVVKTTAKYLTVTILGHLITILWTKVIISCFYFKDYYIRNKIR